MTPSAEPPPTTDSAGRRPSPPATSPPGRLAGATEEPGDTRPGRLAGATEGPGDLPRGRLVGVGVGPGDPRLVTLQALDALRHADQVVAPSLAADAVGRAESIVRQVAPDVTIERLVFDMSPAADDRRASHQRAAAALLSALDAGDEVAFVTLGDPNIYSTFPAVAAAVAAARPGTDITTVAGIMAFQDLAARSATVLLDGTETLHLVTALDGTAHLEDALADADQAVIVYKGGRRLPDILKALANAGRLDDAVIGELLGLPGQRVAPAAEWPDQPASYLATVIVPPAGRRREEHR